MHPIALTMGDPAGIGGELNAAVGIHGLAIVMIADEGPQRDRLHTEEIIAEVDAGVADQATLLIAGRRRVWYGNRREVLIGQMAVEDTADAGIAFQKEAIGVADVEKALTRIRTQPVVGQPRHQDRAGRVEKIFPEGSGAVPVALETLRPCDFPPLSFLLRRAAAPAVVAG